TSFTTCADYRGLQSYAVMGCSASESGDFCLSYPNISRWLNQFHYKASKQAMVPVSDNEIIRLIKNPSTNEKGFRILIETYQKRVYGIIRKMVVVHEDTDDIVQNTFIKAYNNINKFKGESSLFTWLYRIATNESLNFLEKKKRRYFIPLEDHVQTMERHIDNAPYISGDEIQKKLQKAILKLPEKQRLVFNLKYFEDLSYQEISEVTNTSIGSLKASYHHAVKKIEHTLKADDLYPK